jgi:hypothetical protein
VAIGGVNGDGSADLVVGSNVNSSFTTGNVSVLLNQGDGSFGAPLNSDSGYYTNAVALGDLNGDGRPDLVTANLYGYSLSVFLNQSEPITLQLIALDGVTVLATAEAADNIQASFSNVIAADTGTYYLRVSGPPTFRFYTLVATRDAVLDLDGNDSIATAQPLGPVHVALGNVGAPGDPVDVYSFTAAAGETIHLFTTTPGDGPGEFVNILNPHIRLFDAFGNLLAEGVPTADGRNEDITYTTADAGSYFVEVSAEDGTAGEYVLDPSSSDVAWALAAHSSVFPSSASGPLDSNVTTSVFTDASKWDAPPASPRASGIAIVPPQTEARRTASAGDQLAKPSSGSVLSLSRKGRIAGNSLAAYAMPLRDSPAHLVSLVQRESGFAFAIEPSEPSQVLEFLIGEAEGKSKHLREPGKALAVAGSPVGTEPAAEDVGVNQALLEFAWDACLAAESSSSSLTDRDGQALIGSVAALAAIELYVARRRDAEQKGRPHARWTRLLPADPRDA